MDKYLIPKNPLFSRTSYQSFSRRRESIPFYIHSLKLFSYNRNRDISRATTNRTTGLKPRFRIKNILVGNAYQNNKPKWRTLAILLILVLSACTEQKPSINIAVASNFESTLKKIVKRYKSKYPNVNINIIPGSSGVIANQIINNAPYDLFLSADEKKPEFLFQQLKLQQSPRTYAIGKLALWIPSIDTTQRCIDKLKIIDTLVIANPKTAPYGSVASIILKKHKIQVKKTVYANNISQSFLYTKEGYAQAGFVAYSMLKGNQQGCQQIFEDRALSQAMLLINNKGNKIYDFILSKKIQLLIQESGYNTLPINSTRN